MQFNALLLLAFAPIALSAVAPESDTASTKTLTLVPSGYTPPVSTQTPTPTPTSISTVTPTSTPTPTSTWTPKSSSTPSSASLSKVASTSTPLIKATAVETETSPASTSPPANGAATHQLPGAVAAGVVAIAGLLMI